MGLKNTYQARKRFTKTPVKSTGMWYQDGDVIVPSNQITMKGPQGQPNYFNSPILGVGMQSGETQVMQPGREYLFPNDQSVYETKMQNGGINLTEDIKALKPKEDTFGKVLNYADLATDVMQAGHFIPHPVGQAVGYVGDFAGAGIDALQSIRNVSQGNYTDAAVNAGLALLPMGAGKQGYKRANSLISGKGSGYYRPLQPLPHLRNNPVIKKGIGWNRATLGANALEVGSNINLNNNQNNDFGGYQDNTRLAPSVKPERLWYTPQMWDNSIDRGRKNNQMQNGGMTPIYTSDPNDPRLRSYQDSLSLYKAYIKQDELMGKGSSVIPKKEDKNKWTIQELKNRRKDKYNPKYKTSYSDDFKSEEDQFAEGETFWSTKKDKELLDYYKSLGFTSSNIMYHSSPDVVHPNIRAIGSYYDGTAQSPIYKKPVQPIKYRNPEIVAKQQQLIDAGYDIGEVDGIWGKKSQEAFNQMNASTSNTQKNSYTPSTVVVKQMTQDQIDTLKSDYEKRTGKKHTSKDDIYENLKKSLGRSPTISEYNNAIDEYNKRNTSMQNGGLLPRPSVEVDPEMMFRDKYNTQLTPKEQKEFESWAAKESKRQGRDILMDMGAYDMKGFWKSGDYKNMGSDNHGTDTWKKPNHPTFSNQSRYHGADGWYGGNWTDKGGYQPSKQTLETYGPEDYDWMFKSEPGRIEHLDMSRYESGLNKPTPFVYGKGGLKTSYNKTKRFK